MSTTTHYTVSHQSLRIFNQVTYLNSADNDLAGRLTKSTNAVAVVDAALAAFLPPHNVDTLLVGDLLEVLAGEVLRREALGEKVCGGFVLAHGHGGGEGRKGGEGEEGGLHCCGCCLDQGFRL